MESVSPSMVLSMRSMSIIDDENKIDACNKYSKKSPYDWEINLVINFQFLLFLFSPSN